MHIFIIKTWIQNVISKISKTDQNRSVLVKIQHVSASMKSILHKLIIGLFHCSTTNKSTLNQPELSHSCNQSQKTYNSVDEEKKS